MVDVSSSLEIAEDGDRHQQRCQRNGVANSVHEVESLKHLLKQNKNILRVCRCNRHLVTGKTPGQHGESEHRGYTHVRTSSTLLWLEVKYVVHSV